MHVFAFRDLNVLSLEGGSRRAQVCGQAPGGGEFDEFPAVHGVGERLMITISFAPARRKTPKKKGD